MPASGLDNGAYPHLMVAMEAASLRDLDGLTQALTEAESHLPQGRRHKARPEIEAARHAATTGAWDTAWIKVHHALCGLTTMFPPDLSQCPPAPSERNSAVTCSSCSAELSVRSRFCASCGAPVTPA
jgi:hypothetical protein